MRLRLIFTVALPILGIFFFLNVPIKQTYFGMHIPVFLRTDKVYAATKYSIGGQVTSNGQPAPVGKSGFLIGLSGPVSGGTLTGGGGGSYFFGNLPAGSYNVHLTLPANYHSCGPTFVSTKLGPSKVINFCVYYAAPKPPPSPSPTPPPAQTCNGITSIPGHIDPYVPFSVSAGIIFADSTSATNAKNAGDKIGISVNGASFSYPLTKFSPNLNGNVLDVSTPKIGPAATGTYTVTWNLYDASGTALLTPACSQPLTVAYLPFFAVQGGDVSVGASMGIGGIPCDTPADARAGVVSWSREGPNYVGAGTQYAAFALNYLQDFATAQATVSLQPAGLSFSNTKYVQVVGIGEDTYGGDLGSEQCVPDYYKPPVAATAVGDTTINTLPVPGTTTQYISSGNVIIDLPGSVPNGSKTTIYVDGDVYIAHNVTFSNNYPGGLSDIPAFNIIANGNIYIDPTVSEVDGVYIAEPTSSSSNGVIYTCGIASGYNFAAASLTNSLYNTCNTRLDVYGSLIARQVRLLRTYGTLHSPSNKAAEAVIFSPEAWLGNGIGSVNDSYDSISSLPPVL